jgi:hypothetical protein
MSHWKRRMLRSEALKLCRTLVRQHEITEAELTVQPGPKVTIGPCLGYDPRYQIKPGTRTFGCGFGAVGIGKDVDTGKPWAPGQRDQLSTSS